MRSNRFPLLLLAVLLAAATLYCGEGAAFNQRDPLAAYLEKPSADAVLVSSVPQPDGVFCRQALPVEKDFSVRHAAKKKLLPLYSSSSTRMEKKKIPESFSRAIRRSDATNALGRFEWFYRENHQVFSARGSNHGKITDPPRAGPF